MNNAQCQRSSPIDAQLRSIFAKYPNIRFAILFGSMAENKARPDSDLDVAVLAGGPLEMHEKMQLIDALAEATGRPVDLVDLFTVGEPLLGQIIAKGRRILGGNSDYARIMIKHLSNQADFLPYRNRILKERRRRWIGQ